MATYLWRATVITHRYLGVAVLLMLGGTALSATGVYLAFWRIKRDLTFAPRRRVVRQPAE